MLDFWGRKKVEGWLAPVAIAGYAAFFITDKGVTELELVSCLMHLLFAAAAYASQEMWQCVGLRLVCNMCLLIFECASVLARNFMRFTGRASQSQLPRCPVPYLMAYFAGWEADSGHSQPMLILMVYILELALRWMMAAAVAAASIPPLHAEFAWLCRTDPKGRKVKVKVIP